MNITNNPKKVLRLKIVWFFLLQCLIRLIVSIINTNQNESSGFSEEKQLRQRSDYSSLSAINSWSNIYRSQAAVMKNGDMNIRTGIYDNTRWLLPEWWTNIAKAGHMYELKQTETAHIILNNTYTKDPRLTSLILWIRSWLFCKQRLYAECWALARDSVIIDPYAPLGYYLMGQQLRINRNYTEAKKFLEQYEQLSGVITNDYLFNRGLVYYYTRDRELSTADLNSITGDPVLGFEATIFLGRNQYDIKNYDKAKSYFARSLEKNMTWNALPYLWLARTARKVRNYDEAYSRYNSGYELFPNNIELITDMMQLAKITKNQELIDELRNAITMSLWSSVYNHELAGRRYREIGETQASEDVIRLWMTYLSGIVMNIWYAEQVRSLETQLHNTLIKHIIDRYSLFDNRTQSLYKEIDSLNINESQTIFIKMLQNKLYDRYNPATPSPQFSGRILTNDEFAFAKVRYNILTNDFDRSLISLQSLEQWKWNDIKIARLRAAHRMQQGNLPKAYEYINIIRNAWYLAKLNNWEQETEFRLRQQAMRPFKPWIDRLLPFVDPDKLLD